MYFNLKCLYNRNLFICIFTKYYNIYNTILHNLIFINLLYIFINIYNKYQIHFPYIILLMVVILMIILKILII